MRRVSFAHHGRAPVLRGASLTVDAGETVVLEGPSGGGKSTLIRLACGLIPRVQGGRLSGEVLLDGRAAEQLPARDLPHTIGFVPQDPELAFVAHTVHAELAGVLENVGVVGREARLAVEEALGEVDALHLAGRETHTLSGGEAARAALAAAMVARPQLLLLDEPDGQLDAAGRQDIAATLRALRAGGLAVLLAAHPPHPFVGTATRPLRIGDEAPAVPLPDMPAQREGEPLLVLEGAVHRYANDAGVGPIDLCVAPGEIVALAGPNGAGKTTLLHLAAGLVEPHDGRVLLLGRAPHTLEAPELARRSGVAFQHPAWHITQDTVAAEIVLTSRAVARPVCLPRVLEAAGLEWLAETHPWDLSGGERQRLAVATAAAHGPRVLLLDEPTRGMDAASLARFARLLAERSAHGHATVVATHHPEIAALAHRVVHLERGIVRAEQASVAEVTA